MIRRGRQRSIRSLPQWRVHFMKDDALVGNLVIRTDASGPGIVVVKFPGRKSAVGSNAAHHVNHAGWPEVCPRKFLFARPNNLHRTLRCARQPSGLDRGLTSVLAPI